MRAEAATHAPDEWRLGESAEATASAALSDGDFRTARSLFGEARRHYTAAAQTAGLAAEMKARRVEAMCGDARRLLDAGDLEACRRRLGELEIASPGHAGAELLRREVEARMQAATSGQSIFPSERTDDVGVGTSAIASTPPTVDSPSPPADAVEPPHVDIDDRQRVAAAAPRASPGARRVFDDEPIFPVMESSGESDTGSFSLLDEDLVTAARRSRLRLWVTALVLVAGIALVWVWWSRPVRPKAVPIEPVAVEKAAEATPTSVGSGSRGEKPAADVRERRSTSETSAATSAPDRPTDVARREPPARAAQERAGEKAAAVAPVAKKMTASEKSAFEKAAAVAADRLLSDKTAAADSASTLRATTEAAAPERLPGQRAAAESASSAKASDDKAGEDRGSEKAAIEWAAAEKQLALLKSTAEEARARTMMRREQAVKADADRLARNLFGLAEGKLAEADAHAKNQTLAAATRAYQEGADRYAQATSQARAVREAKTDADSAKTRMAAQKQRAQKDSPEFQAGLAEEKRAAAFYDQYAFKQAAEHFRTAETLFGRGGAPPPASQR
ncbi:MAG: hypothetical protein DMD91_29475 [Candidatus Rokuibacteriota bacterium]|nr:MAG: hypothetical protein DMD91_29475 [Candidatus Rokubacteria bacterium]